METYDTLQRLAAEALGVPPDILQRAKTFREAGIDSLDTLDLIFTIEARFDICLGPEDVMNVYSLRDLAVVVDRLVTRKAHDHVEE